MCSKYLPKYSFNYTTQILLLRLYGSLFIQLIENIFYSRIKNACKSLPLIFLSLDIPEWSKYMHYYKDFKNY